MAAPVLTVRVSEGQAERIRRAIERITPALNADEIVGQVLRREAMDVHRLATIRFMSGPPKADRGGIPPFPTGPGTLHGAHTGALRGSIGVDYTGLPWRAAVGTNMVYAAAHEFGYPPGNIPPRPYLQPALDVVALDLPRQLITAWRDAARRAQ